MAVRLGVSSAHRSTHTSARLRAPPVNHVAHSGARLVSSTRWYGVVKRIPRNCTMASQNHSGSSMDRRRSSSSDEKPCCAMNRPTLVVVSASGAGDQAALTVRSRRPPAEMYRNTRYAADLCTSGASMVASLPAEDLRQRGQEESDVAGAGGVAHAADPPDAPGVGAHAAADLDAEPFEEGSPHRRVVGAVRHPHSGQLGEPVAFLGKQLETH